MKNEKEAKVVLLVLVQGNMSEGARQSDIRTKPASQAYSEGWEATFGKKEAHTVN